MSVQYELVDCASGDIIHEQNSGAYPYLSALEEYTSTSRAEICDNQEFILTKKEREELYFYVKGLLHHTEILNKKWDWVLDEHKYNYGTEEWHDLLVQLDKCEKYENITVWASY